MSHSNQQRGPRRNPHGRRVCGGESMSPSPRPARCSLDGRSRRRAEAEWGGGIAPGLGPSDREGGLRVPLIVPCFIAFGVPERARRTKVRSRAAARVRVAARVPRASIRRERVAHRAELRSSCRTRSTAHTSQLGAPRAPARTDTLGAGGQCSQWRGGRPRNCSEGLRRASQAPKKQATIAHRRRGRGEQTCSDAACGVDSGHNDYKV